MYFESLALHAYVIIIILYKWYRRGSQCVRRRLWLLPVWQSQRDDDLPQLRVLPRAIWRYSDGQEGDPSHPQQNEDEGQYY